MVENLHQFVEEPLENGNFDDKNPGDVGDHWPVLLLFLQMALFVACESANWAIKYGCPKGEPTSGGKFYDDQIPDPISGKFKGCANP